MHYQLDGDKIALVGHSVGAIDGGARPQFEASPAEGAGPNVSVRAGRVAGPDTNALLVLRLLVGHAAAFDLRGPERFRANRPERRYCEAVIALDHTGIGRSCGWAPDRTSG